MYKLDYFFLYSQSEKLCNESEDHLVMLLNQLCSRLRDSMELIEVFFNAKEDKFIIFSILLRFLHVDGHVGSQARDALLLCISLSKTHEGIGKFIATGTDFCQVSFLKMAFLRLCWCNVLRKID